MLVMTAKVDKRKIILALVAVLAAVGIVAAAAWGSSDAPAPAPQPPSETPTETAAPAQTESTIPKKAAADTNNARVKFLTELGWEVTVSPTESMEVKLPKDSDEVFQRYNTLQKSQGFDLSRYAGKTVMRYVYQVNNYPDAAEPVYATVLVYKDRIIGGDITNTAPDGKIQGFAREDGSKP